jgi:hypothetical protein
MFKRRRCPIDQSARKSRLSPSLENIQIVVTVFGLAVTVAPAKNRVITARHHSMISSDAPSSC